MSKRIMLLSSVALAAAMPAGVAFAQERPAPTATEVTTADQASDDIVVTARRRDESQQGVPVIVSVITAETLEQSNITGLQGVATRVPSLVLGGTPGSLGPQVALRGIGPSSLTPTNDQSVSLNIDGVPLSQGWAYNFGLFDVGQIEILRGPQSLFFGKNNTAGVIALRSADPTNQVELYGRVGYEFEAAERVVEAVASGPVSDTLRLRLAARYSDQDGYFRNLAVATPGLGGITPAYRNYAPTTDLLIRGTMIFEPSDSFSARLKVNYNEFHMDGGATPQQPAFCPDGTGGVAPTNIAFIGGDDCRADRFLRLVWFDPANFNGILNDGRPFQDLDQTLVSLELNYALSDALRLTSVTGFSNLNTFVQNLGAMTGTTVPLAAQIRFEDHQFTQELRLTSSFSGPINFMVGAFYQRASQSNQLRLPGNSALGLATVLQNVRHEVEIESTSVFAQLQWNILSNLELSGGARLTDETRDHAQINLNPAQGALGPTVRPDPHLSSSNISPEVTLTYRPTDYFTAFVAYRTGFKSGSFSTANFQPATTRASFGDEQAHGYEVGLRFQTRGRELSGSLAVYDYTYEDLQVGANELSAIGGGNFIAVNRTLNAASATVRGVEFDARYAPAAIRGLSFMLSANYNRARYGSFRNAPCGNGQTIAQGCDQLLNPTTGRFTSQDLSGRPLVRAPDWTGYAGFDYSLPVSNDMRLNFGAGINYSSSYQTVLASLAGFEQPAYTKINANISLSGPNDRWQIALVGNNLADTATRAVCTNSNMQNSVFGGQIAGAVLPGPAGGDEAGCTVERGRQLWVRLTWRPF